MMAARNGKKSKTAKSAKAETEFCLVQWLEDNTVSVIPLSTAENREKVFVSAVERFKWFGKYYDGEVLSMSCKFSCCTL